MTLSHLWERVPEGRERVVVSAPVFHRVSLWGVAPALPVLWQGVRCVAKVPHNDANLVLASLAFAVTLRGLFGGRLSACAAPA